MSDHSCPWATRTAARRAVLLAMHQPLTVSQCARRSSLPLDACKHILRQFVRRELATCLNGAARSSRVYRLTATSVNHQVALRGRLQLEPREHLFPDIPWDVYGEVCYRHRATVLRALSEPMNPAAIRRRVRVMAPDARISMNNVYDVLQAFVRRGIARSSSNPGDPRVFYDLTERGSHMRHLLLRVEERV